MIGFRIAFRNILKKRRRTAITLSALAIGYLAITMFQGYVADTLHGLRRAAIRGEGIGHLTILKKGALLRSRMDEKRYTLTGAEIGRITNLLQSVPGIILYSPRLDISGLLSNGKESVVFIGHGIDPEAYGILKKDFVYTGQGTPISPTNAIGGRIAGDLAAAMGLALGDTTVIFSTTLDNHMNALDMEIQGIYNTGTRATNDKYIIIPLSLAQRLYDTDGASRLSLLVDEKAGERAVMAQVRAVLDRAGLDMDVRTWKELSNFYTSVAGLFGMIFLFLFIIILVVAVMGVLNTMSMSVMERFREIGTMRAFGLQRGGVIRLFCIEGFLLGLIGVGLGALLALCLAAMALMRQRHLAPTERAILWPDAIGLGLFTAIGVDLGLAVGLPALAAVMMGVITSCFGGVLRDVLCNLLPSAFSDHRPYALWSFAGGWLHVGLLATGLPPWLVLTTTVVFTAGMRLLSVWRGWALPGWRG